MQDTNNALLGHDLAHHYMTVAQMVQAKCEQGEDIRCLICKCFCVFFHSVQTINVGNWKRYPKQTPMIFSTIFSIFRCILKQTLPFSVQDDKAAEGEVAATVVPPESTAPVAPSPTPEAAAADLNAGSEFATELACKMEALEAQEAANKRKVRFDQHSPNKMFPTFPTKGSQHSSSNEKIKPFVENKQLEQKITFNVSTKTGTTWP